MAVDHNNPQSRNEEILIATIDGNEYDKAPQSRMEELLLELKETIEEGGGGGGTTNYENLSNQPQVNGETLIGNKTGADLGLVDAVEGKDLSTNDYDDNEKAAVAAATSAISAMKDGTDLDSFGDVETALAGKQGTLTAGDYISINNNEIKVSTSKGTELHTYKFTTQNGGYGMMIEKYVKGTKVSETTYSNGDVAGQEIDIDGVMTFGYSYAGYLWHYTLLVDSREHLDGQTVSWYYSNPVEYTENFDIAADESKNLVLKEDLDAAVSAAYHHAGTKTVAQLTHDLLIAANEGNVYNITDSGTTTSDFIEGIGKTIDEGSNVGICKVGNAYMFDLLSGFVDTTNFVQKSQTAGLLKNDGTVDTTIQGDVSTLKSGFTNLDNEVNGDATTYPYADVITVDDAVPANLADCSVKIEPVQDLHGYDKPWVGGAGKNKLNNDDFEVGVAWNGDANQDRARIIIPCKANTTYTLSMNGINNLDYISYGYYETTPALAGQVEFPQTFTTENNSKYIVLGFNKTSIAQDDLVALKLQLEEGSIATDYSPYSNICPISGHTEAVVTRDGKNLFNINDTYINRQGAGGTYNISGNSITVTSSTQTSAFAGFIKPLEVGETYTISYTSTSKIRLLQIDEPISVITQGYYGTDTDSGTSFVAIKPYVLINCVGDTSGVTYSNIQLEKGSSATDYEPFKGKTYTIALGDTIYGGTVDFKTGVMNVTHKYVDAGDLTYNEGSVAFYATSITDFKRSGSAGNEYATYCISSAFEYYANSGYEQDANAFSLYYNPSVPGCRLTFNKTNFAGYTTTQFKQWLTDNNVQICYELATPTTIQLTPQQIQLLQGTNTLYASTGDISVTVNGVSGAIGSVQEQVNGIAEDVALKQNATDNNLQTTDKTIVGAINEHEGDIGSLMSGLTNVTTENVGGFTFYKVGRMVMLVKGDGVVSTNADGEILNGAEPLSIPSAYIPINTINFTESYANKRITISAATGLLTMPNDKSAASLIIRTSVMWIA